MRVIGGEFRSRRLKAPPGLKTRPTPDRLRESLFNILAPRLQGAVFADLYAGSGSVGIEALSRGARKAAFVEIGREAARVIRENLKSLGIEDRAQVIHGSAAIYLAGIEADIYFLAPPYAREAEYDACLRLLGGRGAGLVVVQHSSRLTLEEEYGRLRRRRVVKQGDNCLSFYEEGPA